MKIVANNISRKFIKDWVIKNFNYTFESGKIYGITGPNGSGKSTVLQLIAGITPSSSGTFTYFLNEKDVHLNQLYLHLGIATPYLELIEDFTLQEQLNFHFQFKKLIHFSHLKELLAYIYLEKHAHKQIKFFSSGMKQRLKLALAIFSENQLLLLDEPTTNLDNQGIEWYRKTILEYKGTRTLLICSNMENEYDFADHVINVKDFS